MQSVSSKEIIAGGVDQRTYPDENKASQVTNFRYSPDGGWLADRGWEPLTTPLTEVWQIEEFKKLFSPCRFLQVIQRHSSNEEYFVFERNGNLMFQYGNYPSVPVPLPSFILDEDRNDPKPDDPGTQCTTFGRFTLFVNGIDDMVKWWGRALVEPFGFTQPPPSPIALDVSTYYATAKEVFPYVNTSFISGDGSPIGSPLNNDLNGIAMQFGPNYCDEGNIYQDTALGLGVTDPGAENSYSYKVSYVTDTGSESPLSSACTINWKLPADEEEDTRPDNNQKRYAVYLSSLEPGPPGTVARRIYRTKNKLDGYTGAGDVFYFLEQINENVSTTYVDVKSDNLLTLLAPGVEDSSTISSSYKFCASFNGSMWLAGGQQYPTKIIYSKQGLPEQFGAFDYFDVGVREGGRITALYPYYDVLLVFRERCIDAVFTNASGTGYTCTTINKDIGTTAANTIKLIPGKGVMFLTQDGFFMVTGGMRGGAILLVENMSSTIEKEMKRISKNALPRATAAYSEKEKEYWCHYPVDGEVENTTGIVFNNVEFSWHFRGPVQEGLVEDSQKYLWRFTHISVDQTGNFIMGTYPRGYDESDITNIAPEPGLGLQVWSAYPQMGSEYNLTVINNAVSVAQVRGDSMFHVWSSTWYDFGDDSVKKRILSIEVEVLTEGNNPLFATYYTDYDPQPTFNIYPIPPAGTAIPTVPLQRGEVVGTPKEQATYYYDGTQSAFIPYKQGNPATWNTSITPELRRQGWTPEKPTRVRFDFNTGLIDQFKFVLLNIGTRFWVVKYQINFIGGAVKTINVNQPGAQNQSQYYRNY